MDGSLAQPIKIGAAAPRVDGRLKVTGEARYASDTALADPVFAFLATSAVARGRITHIADGEARNVAGVVDILTHQNIGDAVKKTKLFSDGGYLGSTIMPLGSDQVWHGGQIVAVVLAETFEAAREAAHRLKISYAEETPAASFDSPGATEIAAKDASSSYEDPAVGDAQSAFDSAAVTVDQRYATATTRSSCLRQAALGPMVISRSGRAARTSLASNTGWPSNSASIPRKSMSCRPISAVRSVRAARSPSAPR